MSAQTIRAYEKHCIDRGLPTVRPPPMADDVRRAARKATALAGHVLALANEAEAEHDFTAARALRRIGASIQNDGNALAQAAEGIR